VTTNDGGPVPRKVAADASLGFQHSLVFADSSSGDLTLTLPDGVFAKGYQIVKQGEANRVVLATFDGDNRFEDDSTSYELLGHGEAICTATVGDRLWRFVPCMQLPAGGSE
jgi:hypothetical protein